MRLAIVKLRFFGRSVSPGSSLVGLGGEIGEIWVQGGGKGRGGGFHAGAKGWWAVGVRDWLQLKRV